MKTGFILVVFLIFLSDLFDTLSQLALKFCINSLGMHIDSVKKAFRLVFRLGKFPLAWTGLFFSILSLFIWLFVLTKADLNFAFAMDSMRYVIVAVASMVVLKEKINATRWAGIFAVVCGIVLVSLG